MNREELAWAAGLFDGEGNVRFGYQRNGYGRIQLSVTQIHREVVDRFKVAVGAGAVYGPYPRPLPQSPIYRYDATGIATTRAVIELIWPFLSPVKRTQAADALRMSAAYYALKLANVVPLKTHCVHGHEFTDANTYVRTTRGHGTARICRACRNAINRRSRARVA